MKKFIIPLFFLAMLVSCNSASQETNEPATTTQPEASIPQENLLNIRFDVRGMTCTGCENTIKKGVAELPGVVDVSASHTDSTAIVAFDKTRTSIEDITAVINDKGYRVEGYEMVMQ